MSCDSRVLVRAINAFHKRVMIGMGKKSHGLSYSSLSQFILWNKHFVGLWHCVCTVYCVCVCVVCVCVCVCGAHVCIRVVKSKRESSILLYPLKGDYCMKASTYIETSASLIGASLSEPHLVEMPDELSVVCTIRYAVNHLYSYCAYSCIMC